MAMLLGAAFEGGGDLQPAAGDGAAAPRCACRV